MIEIPPEVLDSFKKKKRFSENLKKRPLEKIEFFQKNIAIFNSSSSRDVEKVENSKNQTFKACSFAGDFVLRRAKIERKRRNLN